jgi:nucleoside-diphosphate kinase
MESNVERSLIIIKPDGVKRRLIGEIIGRIERKGLKLAAMKLMEVSRELAEKHYAVHEGKPFYESLVNFITSGPVVAMAVEGPNAIAVMRKMMGKTFGFEAEPGTIRGDFGVSTQFNLTHGSDAPETAEKELALWFAENEYVDLVMPDEDFCKLE